MKYVYLVQNIHTGFILAAFTTSKVACRYADRLDHGSPNPDLQVIRVVVEKTPFPPEDLA